MGITTKLSGDGSELYLAIDGRFDFSLHQEFRGAYESKDQVVTSYVIDMKATTYLDSSALGMLLLLRDFAGGDHASIQIVHCNQDVKKILSISNFEQLFDIH
ncbi:STAS-domain containing protein [BD1-7 clade bacterium]|uniref:STAS-domain containing protein n=1 Tax=BD1-7 clade bacterium TaxID=2029982 RepID=A0A5S9QW20_9GAMM|nr:STAS-domain containing protein [BD1-7 clade bacterium]CAA0109627.1 STAS-domain containing protein [BD1-7 clade bacterium]CAA0124190.1 STAS-domain containing protein [BD1-7 clade bacterium]